MMLMEAAQGDAEDIKSSVYGRAMHVFKALFQHNILVGLSCSKLELPLKRVMMPSCQVHILATSFLSKLGII